MVYGVPHSIIKHLLPADTDAQQSTWERFVDRADQMQMGRERCHSYSDEAKTLKDGRADAYEGQWLDKWVKTEVGQRLHASERALVPLFVGTTREPPEV